MIGALEGEKRGTDKGAGGGRGRGRRERGSLRAPSVSPPTPTPPAPRLLRHPKLLRHLRHPTLLRRPRLLQYPGHQARSRSSRRHNRGKRLYFSRVRKRPFKRLSCASASAAAAARHAVRYVQPNGGRQCDPYRPGGPTPATILFSHPPRSCALTRHDPVLSPATVQGRHPPQSRQAAKLLLYFSLLYFSRRRCRRTSRPNEAQGF
jgi:hypothetical protein